MKPHIKMILFYWILMVAVECIILLAVVRDPFQNITVLLIALAVLMLQCFVFMMIFCNLPYFAIEVGELYVKGPSMLGLGWRKVVIPYNEFSHIVNNMLLSSFGLYYIKSTRGEIISLMGFTEAQYKELLEFISSRSQPG
jgi:hypothetical protein